jgi:mono/diheme cytochrome c family protein
MMQSSFRNKYLLLPTLIGSGVLLLALSLLTIVARSPYTHSNLGLGFNPAYTRTQQMVVGEPVPVTGDMLAVPRAADLVELGKQLFVSNGCAGCHGLDGHGNIIGPSIVGIKAEKLRVKTNIGPKGMLPYAPGALTDQDLAAIAAYLQAMSK